MLPQDLRPAVQKAYTFITGNLEKGTWREDEELPPIRNLAAQSGVSFVTMIRAVAELKARGLINGVQRGRLRVGDQPSADTRGPRAVRELPAVWLMKRRSLEKDILAGVYSQQNRLPSIKEVGARYGTCFRTTRKILRSLVEDKVLRLRGKSYELPNHPKKLSGSRVVFITYQIQTVPRSALNQGSYQVLALFERECIQQHLNPEIVEIDFYNPVDSWRAIMSTAISNPALGYVLDLWWYPGEAFRQSHIDLLTRLAALNRPTAVLDEIGTFVLPMPFNTNRLFQVFRIEGKRAGASIARLLLGLGHRSVVFISSQHLHDYSQQRLEGITDQYSKAGLADGVQKTVTDSVAAGILDLLDMSGFEDPVLQKIIKISRTKSQAEDQWKAWLRFKELKNREIYSPREVRAFRKNLAAIRDVVLRNPDPDILEVMCVAALTRAGTRLLQISLAPLFEQALKQKEVTAWICVSDATALAALDFLRRRKISVPGEISVAGFDNEPVDAATQRLTSFDFNAQGFIHAMLNFIARPPKPRGPYRHSAIEVEGIVMERETTGSAAGNKPEKA